MCGDAPDVDNATGQSTMLGQRTSLNANVPAQGFTNALTKYYYDPLYQLTRTDYPGAAPFNGEVDQWSYDAIGNRLTNVVNGVPATYTYLKNGSNPLNGQRLSSDGVNAYTWDANGSNLTRNGAPGSFTFGYDPDNRLNSVSGAATATYTYDYQGRRTSKTVSGVTTTYLYDGLNLVGETTGGTVTNYAFGPGIDEPLIVNRAGTISYFTADGLGSIAGTNNAAGTFDYSSVFDAWGSVRSEIGTRTNSFTYTGREVGEAGLHFYRARFLQPGVGRLTQEDRVRLFGGPSNYAYVLNEPISLWDPVGLLPFFHPTAKCDSVTAGPGNPAGGLGQSIIHNVFGGSANKLYLVGQCPNGEKPVSVRLDSAGAPPASPSWHPFPAGWFFSWEAFADGSFLIEIDVPTTTFLNDYYGLGRVRAHVQCCGC